MMFGAQRYLANESATRVARAIDAYPQRYESCLPMTSSWKLNDFTGTVFSP